MSLRAYLHKPRVVMVAQVDMQGMPANYPRDFLMFKNVSVGGITAQRIGMTVLIGSAPGKDDYGRNRIRWIETEYPAIRMLVGRFSEGTNDGETTLVDNSYITVLEDYRVWAKIPTFIGAVIWKDSGFAAFGQVDKPRPVANGGPARVGTVDYFTGRVRIDLDGSKSFQLIDASSNGSIGVSSYRWDIRDGTLISGSLTSATLTVDFPAGFRYVSLTVTSNLGVEHVHYVPVYCDTPLDPALTLEAFQVKSHLQSYVGQEITLEFFNPLPRDQYPDGTLLLLWDDEIPFGATQVWNLLFAGWHQRDEAGVRSETTATLHSTSMTFFDVGKRLETLPGFAQVVEYNAVPTTWMQTKYPTILYYIWYLLYWHSTALEVADLLIDSATLGIYEYVVVGSERATLYTQVESLAAKVSPDHHFTCGRQGQLHLITDRMIMHVPDRPSTGWVQLDDAKWTEVRFGAQRPPRVHQIRTKAIVSRHTYIVVGGKNTIEVIACLAPGEAHGQGEGDLENEQRITLDQYNLNNTEGNRYARLNARYGRFTITLPYEVLQYAFDLALGLWQRLVISADNTTERELPFNARGLVHEMNVQYDYDETGLTRTATLTWEMETSGKPAATEVLWPDTPDETTLMLRSQLLEAKNA